ncbi:MAG: 1-acyl-sn-glycerol-3-phosphate acyltransferase [Elusimicrobia bacterium]|nr:1-acyl-sn-glycerol-3-phosphate acyltransferase [Elusimicrobiota bacterium]
MLAREETFALKVQGLASRAFAWPIYWAMVAAGRLYFRYKFSGLKEFRREIWEKLESREGPVIWAANHLTLIDSFLVFWAVCPWRKAADRRLGPWSTPEYRNYYHLGGFFKARLIRGLMYLCRCIPFLREGEDEASARWRERVFDKCAWLLNNGGSVFIYPEAGRSRSGWLDRRKPKDFLGRLALMAPNASFLCVYLRGESQLYTTAAPAKGETFRMHADLIPAVLPGETAPRQISQRLFDKLSELQNLWFAGSALPKNCGGNDIVDLNSPLAREHFDPETGDVDPDWSERHFTAKERAYLAELPRERVYPACWKFLAAKEASHKALSQSGIHTPSGGFLMLQADLFRRRVLHRPTGAQVEIAFTDEGPERVHCLAVFRGGSLGSAEEAGDVLWEVSELPQGARPQDHVREMCLRLIASSSDEIKTPDVLSFTEVDGIPKVLYKGKAQDWGLSLSHSGRFTACSFMIS